MERYVLLGLAPARADWFRAVGQWATSAAIPAEFLRCVSAEELRTRLAGDRPYSATLLDGSLPSVDRDLIGDVREAGAAAVVIDDGRIARDWTGLGASAVLPLGFGRDELLDVLGAHARLISSGELATGDPERPVATGAGRGRSAAVLGPGGTGASTVAIGLAQGLARRPDAGSVLLADLCRHAEQAMLHDSRDVVPGLQELVDAHRGRTPEPAAVRELTFDVPQRGYRLLVGLRRARYWSALRPRALEAAYEGLRRTFDLVVADTDPDLEGEEETGALEVEERHLLARLAVARADAVFAVGLPGMKGTFSLVRVVGSLVELGVPTGRIVPVVNQAPRSPKARSELARAFADLTEALPDSRQLPSPLFLPRRRIDETLRDGAPVPAPLPELLAGAWAAVVERAGRTREPLPWVPRPVAPGSLGATFLATREPEP